MTGPETRRFHLVIRVDEDVVEIVDCRPASDVTDVPKPKLSREPRVWTVHAKPDEQVIFTAEASTQGAVTALHEIDDTVFQRPWTPTGVGCLQSYPFKDPRTREAEQREKVEVPLAVLVPGTSGKPNKCPTTIVFGPRLGDR